MNTTTSYIKEQDANPYKREQTKIDAAAHQLIKDRIARIIAATCGGTPCVDRAWRHGDIWVSHKPRTEVWEYRGEPGWFRWRLVSSDGLVRKVDPGAPCVHLSPSGAIFWLNHARLQPKRITGEQLFELCQKLAEKVEVQA